ncbi:MAG: VCBS repeat-containing protein [Bacteroidota bacterium]
MKRRFHSSDFLFFCILLLAACGGPGNTQRGEWPMFSMIGAEQSGIQFQNRLRESPSQNVLAYEYFYNGAGLAIADFNGDELPDLYLVSNLEANQLYLNQGNCQFRDVSQAANGRGPKGFSTGVATVDINADGRMDLYLCQSGRFTDPDRRRNQLLINQGNNPDGIPQFVESAAEWGLDLAAYSTQASFFDVDRDGDLDMFLINHDIDTYPLADIPQRMKESSQLVGDMLFENQNGHFVDITEKAGLINNQLGFGLGIAVSDLNQDGWPDVYVSTDYSGRDHLYINQQDGTFSEEIQELTPHTSFYSMGNDVGDINRDGWPDIMNLDMVAADNYGIKTSMSAMNPEQFHSLVDQGLHHQYMYNSLLLNQGKQADGKPYFSNVAQMAGVSSTGWSWAPLLFDFDNDGWQDLFVSNGIKRNIRNNDAVKEVEKMTTLMQQLSSLEERTKLIGQMLQRFPYHRTPNYFFQNKGALQFEDISASLGMDSLPTASNGAAWADLDADGDLDLVINNVDQPLMLLRNNSRENHQGHFLQIQLEGTPQNPLAIGTRIRLRQGRQTYFSELYTSRGYLSAVEPLIHIGLAGSENVSLTLFWPDGTQQFVEDVRVDQRITLSYDPTPSIHMSKRASTLFSSLEALTGLAFHHHENPFDDFAQESLLPHKMSQMGPAVASGDVNGDGLEDLWIGGAKGQAAVLFLQQADGSWSKGDRSIWEKEKNLEDGVAAFIDLEKDGDLDLLVGNGSNELPEGRSYYALRYYENDGKGRFQRNGAAIPGIRESIGAIAVADVDEDGDEDVFIGGRQVPGKYPFPANSYLLLNEQHKGTASLRDVSDDWGPFLQAFGMITDAHWVDINQDGKLDLLTAGEWMSPQLLINTGQSLANQSEQYGLSQYSGWWSSLEVSDHDGDGDLDFFAGNLGLNYKYKASQEAPFQIFADDFDDNGSIDIVLGYQQAEELFPLRGRECSSNQMPFIKTKFPTYDAFGKASLHEVFGQQKLSAALHYQAYTFANSFFENDGQGHFVQKDLPRKTQISSVNDMLYEDFDGDGIKDLLLAGNLYGSEVETPRNDASYGSFLKASEDGRLLSISASQSGLLLTGEVRHLRLLHLPSRDHPVLIVVKNNAPVQIVSCNGIDSDDRSTE